MTFKKNQFLLIILTLLCFNASVWAHELIEEFQKLVEQRGKLLDYRKEKYTHLRQSKDLISDNRAETFDTHYIILGYRQNETLEYGKEYWMIKEFNKKNQTYHYACAIVCRRKGTKNNDNITEEQSVIFKDSNSPDYIALKALFEQADREETATHKATKNK